MFLEYLSLAILLMGLTMVFYAFVYIHDLPYEIAKKRNHPQTETIHTACWLSLFTLHALWPLVFIWAISKQGPVAVATTDKLNPDSDDLKQKLLHLEQRLQTLEKQGKSPSSSNN